MRRRERAHHLAARDSSRVNAVASYFRPRAKRLFADARPGSRWGLGMRGVSAPLRSPAFAVARAGGASRDMSATADAWTKKDLRHTSALVLVPPRDLWGPIQAIRATNDKSYLRWMPHVNLLYPFLRDDARGETFAAAAALAERALAGVPPFRVRLDDFRHFQHRTSCTVWLHPSDPRVEDAREPEPGACAGVMAAQAALEAAFPFADHLSGISPAGFTPHLSVGQWPDQDRALVAAAEMRREWRPIEFEVDAVYLISRAGADDPFRVQARVPLGRDAARERRIEAAAAADAASDAEEAWWTDAYRPPPPPPGARCLEPKPSRERRGRRGGGRRTGRGNGRGGEEGFGSREREWINTTN